MNIVVFDAYVRKRRKVSIMKSNQIEKKGREMKERIKTKQKSKLEIPTNPNC